MKKTDELINSRNHISIKKIRDLQIAKKRRSTGTFFAEGMRCLSQALEFGMHLQTLVYAPSLMESTFARGLVSKIQRSGIPSIAVTAEVFHSISQTNNAHGMGAVIQQKIHPLRHANPDEGICWIALSHVQSAGNLGTIVRTADAAVLGVFGVVGDDIDPYESGTVRASMGSLFAQRFVRTSMEEFVVWKKANRCALIGTSPSAGHDYHTFDYPQRTILFVGSERKGLSEEELRLCDELVRIPMAGKLDSLNVAIATSVLLYELYNRRRMADHSIAT